MTFVCHQKCSCQLWVNDCDPITLDSIAPEHKIAVMVKINEKGKWAQFDAYSLAKWMFESGERSNPLTRERIDDDTLHRIDRICQFAIKNGTWWFFVATNKATKRQHYIWRKHQAIESIEEEINTYIRYILSRQEGSPVRSTPGRRLFINNIVLIIFKLKTLFILATHYYKVDITINDLLDTIRSDIVGVTDTLLLRRGITVIHPESFHS